jgi:hypothetical protein
MITQRDSTTMVGIGQATKADSSAMKTVAMVTMIFLPATFTSVSLSIFSIKHTKSSNFLNPPALSPSTKTGCFQHELFRPCAWRQHSPRQVGHVGQILDILGRSYSANGVDGRGVVRLAALE